MAPIFSIRRNRRLTSLKKWIRPLYHPILRYRTEITSRKTPNYLQNTEISTKRFNFIYIRSIMLKRNFFLIIVFLCLLESSELVKTHDALLSVIKIYKNDFHAIVLIHFRIKTQQILISR